MDRAILPDKKFKDAICYLRNDSYTISTLDGEFDWFEFKKIKIKVPLVNHPMDIFREFSNSISQHWDIELSELCKNTDISTIRKAIKYLSNFREFFEINRLARNGLGVKQVVDLNDKLAYDFLLNLSGIFPVALYPSFGQPMKFYSKIPPLRWWLKDHLLKKIPSTSSAINIITSPS